MEYDELKATLEPVSTNSREIGEIRGTLAEGDSRPRSIRMQKLLMDLSRIDITIVEMCMIAKGMPTNSDSGPCFPEGRPGREISPLRKPGGRFQRGTSALRDILASAVEVTTLPRQLAVVWKVIRFIITAGRTPTLFRWYRVREEVRDMVQHRDILRSQILHQQIILLRE